MISHLFRASNYVYSVAVMSYRALNLLQQIRLLNCGTSLASIADGGQNSELARRPAVSSWQASPLYIPSAFVRGKSSPETPLAKNTLSKQIN